MSNRIGRHNSVKASIRNVIGGPIDLSNPLFPPGGLPLPAIIKKKFSFAPQLPNVSQLSLFPDFTSSQYSFDNLELDSVRSHGQSGSELEKPQLKIIRYELALPGSSTLNPSSTPKLKHTLRRVPGQRSLSSLPDSTTTLVQIALPTKIASSVETVPPAKLSSPVESAIPHHTFASSDITQEWVTAEQHRRLLERDDTLSVTPERERILKKLIGSQAYFFDSFCVVDLQHEGNPVSVLSLNLLPEDLPSDGEALFMNTNELARPWQVFHNNREDMHHLVAAGDLIEVSSGIANHRFFAPIDLKGFTKSLVNPDSFEDKDIWLLLAHEEMKARGLRIRRPLPSPTPVKPVDDQVVISVIQEIYKNYLIIGPSKNEPGEYWITHISPSLRLEDRTDYLQILSAPLLRQSIKSDKRFAISVTTGLSGGSKKLYCIPMYGPGLSCWIGFLIDSKVPDMWA